MRKGIRLTMRTLLALVLLPLISVCCHYTKDAAALPIQQVLSHSSSSIKFGIESKSPTLQMQGSFKEFRGSLALDPSQPERSLVHLTLNLQSAQLSPDQILQAVLLQTALAQLKVPSTTFKSTEIRRGAGDTYLITGSYTWMGKSKMTTVPVRIISVSPFKTEIRLLLNGTLQEQTAPQQLSDLVPNARGSKGWAKATLVFLPSKGY